jgi:hypothetical protein
VPAAAFERMAAATRAQLAHRTGSIAIRALRREGRTIAFDVRVENHTGHKLPSGYPSRRAWIAVEILRGRDRVFASGVPDASGRLPNVADELALPHVDLVRAAGDVPVYEMIASDESGARTTSLLSMTRMEKDTRLLPRGWRADGPHADETKPVGLGGDDDFAAGGDTVSYAIELPSDAEGRLTVIARFLYQPIPPAWVDALRGSRTSEAREFVRMFDALEKRTESIGVAVETLD